MGNTNRLETRHHFIRNAGRGLLVALFILQTVPASSAILPMDESIKTTTISHLNKELSQAARQPVKVQSKTISLAQKLGLMEIDLRFAMAPKENAVIDRDTKELNLGLLKKAQMAVNARRFNPANYVPYQSLSKTDGTSQVASKILSKTVQTIVNREMANSSLLNLPIIKTASYVKSVKAKNYRLSYGIRNTVAETELKVHNSISATLSYNVASPEVNFGFNWNF